MAEQLGFLFSAHSPRAHKRSPGRANTRSPVHFHAAPSPPTTLQPPRAVALSRRFSATTTSAGNGARSATTSGCSSARRHKLLRPPGPRWKKGKDGKDFAALAAANPMSKIVAELQASLRDSEAVAILSAGDGGRDAILAVAGPHQAALLNRAAFGRAVENAGEERQWFQLGPEEVFFLHHALRCIAVETENKKRQMGEGELWDLLTSTSSEPFREMYKAYEHLRLKNWVVRSGLQYGANFVAYRHHPALVHSEFAVIVVPEGKAFGTRCGGRVQVWSDLLCALRASGSVAKTLLVLTISTENNYGSSDCLEQMIVHERTITRWVPQQCREQQDHKPPREEPNRDVIRRRKPCGEEASREEQDDAREGVVFSYWGVILSFTILSSLLVYKLKF